LLPAQVTKKNVSLFRERAIFWIQVGGKRSESSIAPIGGQSRLVRPSIALSASTGDRKALDLVLIALVQENIRRLIGVIAYQVAGCRDENHLLAIGRDYRTS